MLPSQSKRLYEFLGSIARDVLHQLEESANKQEAAIREAAKTREEKQSEVGSAIAVAINTASETVPDYEKRQRHKEHRLQWGLLFVTLFGALAAAAAAIGAIIYARIAKDQLTQMIEATDQTRRSADIAARALGENQRQFGLTSASNTDQFNKTLRQMEQQSRAAKDSAQAAQDAVTANKEAVYVEQRPWVGVDIALAPSAAKEHNLPPEEYESRVVVSARNTGRTPAVRVRIICCEYTSSSDAEKRVGSYDELRITNRNREIEKHKAELRSMYANNPFVTEGDIAEKTRKWFAFLDAAQAEYAPATEWVIVPGETHTIESIGMTHPLNPRHSTFDYVLGKITYFDLLRPGLEHRTEFCVVHENNLPMRLCRTGQSLQ